MKGKISEVFDSIQGEGLYLGEKQIFVRFFGCNLNCKFCDTRLGYFIEYEPQQLYRELKLFRGHFHSISFTGGEPLTQKDFLKTILKLTRQGGYRNYLETNGILPKALEDVIDYVDIIAMDIKLPSSTAQNPFWDEHRKFLQIASRKEVFLKTVICSSTKESDLDEAISLIREVNKSLILVLQPNSYEKNSGLKRKLLRYKNICSLEDITSCVIAQMHKILGLK